MPLYSLLRQFLFSMDPERVHDLALGFLTCERFQALLKTPPITRLPLLEKNLWGLTFPNPIGLAAGFDKNAVALRAWERLGFGFMELGTITRYAQPGNLSPRILRIPSHQALINRMGFPNEGAEAIARRLHKIKDSGSWPGIPVGINLGKSKITPLEEAHEDYRYSCAILKDFADYLVINVSSPNTPGLRSLQGREQLEKIVATIQDENHRGHRKPLLVKIAPDLTEPQLDEVLEVIQAQHCDGIVATNTTLDKSSVPLQEEGGLSGVPLRKKSTEIIRMIARKTSGTLPIIGVGGIFTATDAIEKLEAGATLIQSYTGFIYEGPGFVRRICEALAQA